MTPSSAAEGVEHAFKMLEGRWKLLILFHLFRGKVRRFSELERAIPAVSQKMLIRSSVGSRPTASSNASSTLRYRPRWSIG